MQISLKDSDDSGSGKRDGKSRKNTIISIENDAGKTKQKKNYDGNLSQQA